MTPEQQALLDKAQRSIEAAQKLHQECLYEFSASCSYYAMFYVAEAFLDKEGLSFSSHAAVISAFGQHLARTNKVPVEFHRQLIDAQSQRTRADYDPEPDITQEDAEVLIRQAQTFLTTALQSL